MYSDAKGDGGLPADRDAAHALDSVCIGGAAAGRLDRKDRQGSRKYAQLHDDRGKNHADAYDRAAVL